MEVKLEGVGKEISGRRILSDVTFDIRDGECVGLVGPNGAGKTSIIRCMLGLYSFDGKITFDGTDAADMEFLKAKVTFVLDNAGLFRELNVHDNLEFFYRAYNGPDIDRGKMEARISGILADVGLFDRSGDLVSALSKGMKQRLAIGRTMVVPSPLLILDEPFTGLDVEGQIFMIEHIKAAKAAGTAVLVSSHDLGHLQEICDSVVFIKEGRVLRKMAVDGSGSLKSAYIDLMMVGSI